MRILRGESNPKREGVFANKPGAKAAAVKTQADYSQEFFAGSVAVDTSFFEYTVLSGSNQRHNPCLFAANARRRWCCWLRWSVGWW